MIKTLKKKKLDELNRLSVSEYKAEEKLDVIVVADNLRSGLNVGSIFRSMDCFKFSKIMLCGVTPTPPHKEITKSAIGATHTVDWSYYDDTKEALKELHDLGYRIIGIEQTTNSQRFRDYQFSSKIAIVMGNEVEGISDDALPMLDDALELEQYGTKHSFNVSVCAGIVLYEINKQLRP